MLSLFSTSSFAEQYPNSWKMAIKCKSGGDSWWESQFVVDVVDDKFTLNFDKMNAVYMSYFASDKLPARTCIGVTGLAVGASVEIALIAKVD